MICEQGGLHAMAQKNTVGIAPSEYLSANPYADVDEMKLIKRFVLEKMEEIESIGSYHLRSRVNMHFVIK